uniref:Uncharacterized protein n=1 Tax=Rhizophora mucronata TaxID=61149 RepID=A0A2P2NA18_RHIMU
MLALYIAKFKLFWQFKYIVQPSQALLIDGYWRKKGSFKFLGMIR